MLTLNTTIFNQVVDKAKESAANDQRWLSAIDKAAIELLENPYIEALDNHTLLIGSASGNIYTANGSCQCKAFEFGQPCRHRAAARLWQRYNEMERS